MNKSLISLLTLLAAAGLLAACSHGTSTTDNASAAAAGEAEEERDPNVLLSREEILAAKCSHGLTHQCEECRYEVGLVRVDGSMLKTAGGTNGLVKLMNVASTTVVSSIHVTGEIRLDDNATVHLSPRVAGVIHAVQVDLGARVKAGDPLFEIESAELGQALSDNSRNRTLAALSRRNYEREKSLFEQKIGSESEMIEAQMRLEEYETALTASAQKLRALGFADTHLGGAETDGAGKPGGILAVRAPIAGTIVEKHAVIGELVEPNRDVMLLSNLESVWVWGSVYDRDLATLLQRRGQGRSPVEVSVRAFPGRVFHGAVDQVSATMDEATRTAKVRVTIDNKEGLLQPGMFCEVRILQGEPAATVTIPKAALLSDEGSDFVFRHFQDDLYVRQPVTKGRDFDGAVEIVQGLATGQVIVAEGAFLLKSDVLRSKMGAGCAD